MTQLVSDKQVKIAQDGDLDPLIKLLRHEDDQVRSLAAKTISNLYISEDQDVMLKEKNGFAPLVELVKMKDDEVRSKAVWSIAILASNDGNQQEIIRQVGWSSVMDLIKDDVVEVQCGGVTLLGNLALLDENKQQIIEKQGVLVLMTLMRDTRDIIVKRAIVTALSNIVDSDNAKDVLDDENLDLLISLLEKSEDERLLSGVVHTISNVANSEDEKFNKTLVRKSLTRLVSLLESPSDVIQKGAVMALNGLSSTDTHQNEILRHGAVKKMVDLLKSTTDNELVLGIVLCLNNIAQKESNQEHLLELGVTDILAGITNETDDPNIKSECSEALRAIGEGKQRIRTEKRKKAGIKENVAKIIQVLINDPGTQDKMRESGVVPHLIYLLDPEQQDDKLKGLALDALTLLAINNLQNQNEIAMSVEGKGMGYLEKIVQNKMEKPRIVMRAVRLIGALCWKNKMIQGLISEKNVVPHLVEMLDTFDNNLKKAVLASIACVAEDNAKNKDYIHKLQGDVLVADIITKETHPDTMVAAAAQAVASLAREKTEIQNVFKRAVGNLVNLLEMVVRIPHGMEDHISQEQFTGALLELARKNKTNQSIMWKHQVRRPLVEILLNAGASSVSHFNSLALFWEFSRSDKKRKKLAKDPDVLRAIRSLSASRNNGLRDAALELKERLKI